MFLFVINFVLKAVKEAKEALSKLGVKVTEINTHG